MIEKYYTTTAGDATELTRAGGYPVDTLANIMPLTPDSVVELAKSIDRNGLRVPITTVNGNIIDGRCRAIACAMVGVEPRFDEVGDLSKEETYKLVLDLNNRRSVSQGQKAVIAAYEVRNDRHKVAGIPNAIEYAKEIWGVGKNTYTSAKYVLTYGEVYALEIKQKKVATVGGISMTLNKLYTYLKKKRKAESDMPNDSDSDDVVLAKCFKAVGGCVDAITVSFDSKVVGQVLRTLGANLDDTEH